MKLIDPTKAKTLEFKWGDAVILVKSEANEDDRLRAVLLGRSEGEPWNNEQKADYCRLACECMVVGWKNVHDDGGREFPYSFEALKLLPKQPGKALFMDLGLFVLKETDFQKGASKEAKKS